MITNKKMKKIYIKPSVSVYSAVLESSLLAGSVGIGKNEGFYGGGCAPKREEITDDSSDDTSWPESESLWD